MIEHELKTDPDVFQKSWNNKKSFEIRKDDRNFQEGDILFLRETKFTGKQMKSGKALFYTGFSLKVRVDYKLPAGSYGLLEGWTVLSVTQIQPKEQVK